MAFTYRKHAKITEGWFWIYTKSCLAYFLKCLFGNPIQSTWKEELQYQTQSMNTSLFKLTV